MTRSKLIVPTVLALSALTPIAAQAANPRPVSCSITVDYLAHGLLRSTYTKDFEIAPGTTFSDDFSTVVRFGFFDAWTSLDDNGDTVVSLSFYRDVTALEYIDLRTSLTVATSKPAKTEGSSAHWQSQIGERTTRWLATCSRK